MHLAGQASIRGLFRFGRRHRWGRRAQAWIGRARGYKGLILARILRRDQDHIEGLCLGLGGFSVCTAATVASAPALSRMIVAAFCAMQFSKSCTRHRDWQADALPVLCQGARPGDCAGHRHRRAAYLCLYPADHRCDPGQISWADNSPTVCDPIENVREHALLCHSP